MHSLFPREILTCYMNSRQKIVFIHTFQTETSLFFFIRSLCHCQIRSTSGPHIEPIIFFHGLSNVVFFLFYLLPSFILQMVLPHISLAYYCPSLEFLSQLTSCFFYFGFFSWLHHTENSSSSRAALSNHDL